MLHEAGFPDDIPERPELFDPNEESMPSIDLLVGEVKYHLTWKNTLVRKFAVGEGEFDHLLHSRNEEDAIFIFFKQMDVGDEILEFLESNNFPIQYNPILDDQCIAFYSKVKSGNLDHEFKQHIQNRKDVE